MSDDWKQVIVVLSLVTQGWNEGCQCPALDEILPKFTYLCELELVCVYW